MTEKTIAPYGSWVSPLKAAALAEAGTRLGGFDLLADGSVIWLEARPAEKGRQVLVLGGPDGARCDLTPAEMNVRTRVHEYGGGDFLALDDAVVFSNFADQALYLQPLSGVPRRLTFEEGVRFADCTWDRRRERLIGVREDHRGDGEAKNGLAAVPIEGSEAGEPLWQESDFVAYPRVSPDGTKLAWIAWDHPNMPWDDVALHVADIGADGELSGVTRVNAGISESVVQPEWAEDGALTFMADRGGFWNLYRLKDGVTEAVLVRDADFAGPLWNFGFRFYALAGDGTALVTWSDTEGAHFGRLALSDGALTEVDTAYVGFHGLRIADGALWFIGDKAEGPSALVRLDLVRGTLEEVHAPEGLSLPPGTISFAEPVTFPTAGGRDAHALYYPPTNPDHAAPAGEKPPLIVRIHGGPTSAASPAFRAAWQFWTSRGFALVDVNYGGSTGYGRAYRERLKGNWGVTDVEDAVAAARHLASRGLADPERLIISGGSAGGYTTLAAHAFTDVFRAGASHYGVSDLEALARDTHKFEARYLDTLVGPYPQRTDLYRERSPIHHLDGFAAPMIFLQGLEDRIVPPAQSEAIVEALKRKGVPVAYLAFEGEQHGFRQAANIIRALEAELYFYGKVFGFEPADDIPPVPIDNLG